MITFINKRGLSDWLASQGWWLECRDNVWRARRVDGTQDDDAVNALIASYDELPEVKREKIAAIRAEGLARIKAVFPAIADFDELKLVANIIQSIAPAARALTADMTKVSQIYTAGVNAIAMVNAASSAESVEAVTPAWPA